MSLLLENKNVFLTGGSRGLGRATILELVRHGADVAFTYLKSEDCAKETFSLAQEINPSSRIFYYQLDVRKSEHVDQVAEKAINDLGRVDVVVNNSGNLRDNLIFNMSNEEWQDVIQVHLNGTFYVCRAFLEEFFANKGGKFINISSLSSEGSPGQANYSAAKAGVIGFSKALAKEYGSKNIYCNVIVPGYFNTDLTKENASPDFIKKTISLSSIKRIGNPEEFGNILVFCASDLSSYINGTVLYATGGY